MVSRESASASVQERVLGGQNRGLQLLAAEGLLPLPPDALVPLQVQLAASEDVELAHLAKESLAGMDPRIVAPVLARSDAPEMLDFFSSNSDHPLILETILRRQGVSLPLLVKMAGRVTPDLQEILILRQDAILEEPAILDALEANPSLSRAVRRRIGEYRQHLLPKEKPAPLVDDVVPEDEDDEELPPEIVEAAIDEAAGALAEGEVDDQTGLSEGQIRTLPIPVRLKLSRGASKTLRDILIRDTNPLVAMSVLQNNSFSDGEIERVANLRTVAEEVLDAIGRTRQWMRKYPIAIALVRNPRTPIPLGVRLVPRLGVRDLKLLRRDRNVSEAVRKTANRLFLNKVQ
jgi:hypothetical protein